MCVLTVCACAGSMYAVLVAFSYNARLCHCLDVHGHSARVPRCVKLGPSRACCSMRRMQPEAMCNQVRQSVTKWFVLSKPTCNATRGSSVWSGTVCCRKAEQLQPLPLV
jgi:hypothetical protein